MYIYFYVSDGSKRTVPNKDDKLYVSLSGLRCKITQERKWLQSIIDNKSYPEKYIGDIKTRLQLMDNWKIYKISFDESTSTEIKPA